VFLKSKTIAFGLPCWISPTSMLSLFQTIEETDANDINAIANAKNEILIVFITLDLID
jgi:hypothetical protein